jgi:bifunctional non-homologous end joining protein LigD
VLVPLGPGQNFTTARGLADLLGGLLVREHPKIATMERVVAKRGPRVYVDTGQTGPTRAIVSPYSVRAVAGATVSMPIDWDEVEPSLDPRAFTIKTVPARLAKRGDTMAELLRVRPDPARAVAKLGDLVRPA